MAMSFVCTLISTRLTIQTIGTDGYAAVSLLATMGGLIPFADLGSGAIVVNAVADFRAGGVKENAERQIALGLRVATGSALVILVAGSILSAAGGWEFLLGPGVRNIENLNQWALLSFSIIALSVPIGIFARVLQGLGLTGRALWLQGTAAPVALAIVVLAAKSGAEAGWFAIAAPLAAFVSAVLIAIICARTTPISVSACLHRRASSCEIKQALGASASYMIITISLAVAFQIDRLVLSHWSTSQQMSLYSVTAPIYTSLMSLLSAVGQYIWPYYRIRQRQGTLTTGELNRHVTMALLAGVIVGLFAVGALRIYIPMATAGSMNADWLVGAAIAGLLVAQAAHLPSALLLTDPQGLAFSARLSILMCLFSMLSSVWLSKELGAAGAYLGSALAVFIIQFPMTWIKAILQLRVARDSRIDTETRKVLSDDTVLSNHAAS